MDALEFLKERKRVCYLYDECDKCPFDSKCLGIINKSDEELKKIVDITEQWLKEHPRKTRQSKFLEMFPNASVIDNGTLGICPKSLDKDRECFYHYIDRDGNKVIDCLYCRNQFWLEEVDE